MRLLPLLALFCACATPSKPSSEVPASPPADERIPERIVELSAVADVNRVGPGQELRIAAVLAIEPGWHVFWQNPGDSGKPTEARVEAPPPFVVGELRYSGPERIELGDEIVFGYRTRAMISARVTAPDQVQDAARFEIAVSWLACKGEVCVPGSATAGVELPAASADRPSAPANQVLFADHDARLPKPLSTLANARHDWRIHDDSAELVVYVDGGSRVEFFPAAGLAGELTGQAMVPGRGVGALHLSFRGVGPEQVRGVMLAADSHSTHYFELDLPGPSTATASK